MLVGLIQADAVNACLGKTCFAGTDWQLLKNCCRCGQRDYFLVYWFEFFVLLQHPSRWFRIHLHMTFLIALLLRTIHSAMRMLQGPHFSERSVTPVQRRADFTRPQGPRGAGMRTINDCRTRHYLARAVTLDLGRILP